MANEMDEIAEKLKEKYKKEGETQKDDFISSENNNEPVKVSVEGNSDNVSVKTEITKPLAPEPSKLEINEVELTKPEEALSKEVVVEQPQPEVPAQSEVPAQPVSEQPVPAQSEVPAQPVSEQPVPAQTNTEPQNKLSLKKLFLYAFLIVLGLIIISAGVYFFFFL